MLKLYREEVGGQADAIEAEFRDLMLGYNRVAIELNKSAQLFGTETALPVITNNEINRQR